MANYNSFIEHLNRMGIKFYENKSSFIVDGDISTLGTSVDELPYNLTVNGFLSVGYSKCKKLPKGLNVSGFLDIEGTKISLLPNDLIVGHLIYVNAGQLSSIPENLKDKICILIESNCDYSVCVMQNSIIIGCKEKSIDEWKYFFDNKQSYITDPSHPHYKLIENDFKEALRVHNLYF